MPTRVWRTAGYVDTVHLRLRMLNHRGYYILLVDWLIHMSLRSLANEIHAFPALLIPHAVSTCVQEEQAAFTYLEYITGVSRHCSRGTNCSRRYFRLSSFRFTVGSSRVVCECSAQLPPPANTSGSSEASILAIYLKSSRYVWRCLLAKLHGKTRPRPYGPPLGVAVVLWTRAELTAK